MNNNLNPLYRVVITPSFFWAVGWVSFSVTVAGLVLRKLYQGYKIKESLIINPKVKKFIIRIFRWVESRGFSDKCIILFMFLLVMCALSLSLGLEPVAEQLANVAYFLLVIGVVGKFIRFLREEKNDF